MHTHTHTHTCMHNACTHTYMHICTHAYMHAYKHINVHACVPTHARACLPACVRTSVLTCLRARVRAYLRACVHQRWKVTLYRNMNSFKCYIITSVRRGKVYCYVFSIKKWASRCNAKKGQNTLRIFQCQTIIYLFLLYFTLLRKKTRY